MFFMDWYNYFELKQWHSQILYTIGCILHTLPYVPMGGTHLFEILFAIRWEWANLITYVQFLWNQGTYMWLKSSQTRMLYWKILPIQFHGISWSNRLGGEDKDVAIFAPQGKWYGQCIISFLWSKQYQGIHVFVALICYDGEIPVHPIPRASQGISLLQDYGEISSLFPRLLWLTWRHNAPPSLWHDKIYQQGQCFPPNKQCYSRSWQACRSLLSIYTAKSGEYDANQRQSCEREFVVYPSKSHGQGCWGSC